MRDDLTMRMACSTLTALLLWSCASSPTSEPSDAGGDAASAALDAGSAALDAARLADSGSSSTPADASSEGGPDAAAVVVPVCTLANQAAVVGASVTLAASCTESPTSHRWTNSSAAGAPPFNPSGATLALGPFTTVGTFTYSVAGVNAAGTGPAASATITVAADPNACTPTTVNGAFTANGIKNLTINQNASVSYALPLFPAGRTIELLSIQSTSSQQDLTAEFAVSKCPGDFTPKAVECTAWGTVNQSGTQLLATVAASPVAGSCTVIVGEQYYVSVRNVKIDRVTPSCTPQTCYMILQLNSY